MYCISAFAEGTKELMPTPTNITRILVANGTVALQQRDPFALEGGDQDYRLCIHISDPLTETIYFGLGKTGSTDSTGSSPVPWRIYAPDNTQAWPVLPAVVTTPIMGQPGYINTYNEAVHGPQILDPLGYNALSYTPTMAGDYYMTFEVGSGMSRYFDYFDITVVSNATGPNTAKLGRVYSKCWQIKNPQISPLVFYTFEAKMYIYSNDGIVTKFDANNFEGRDFSFSANESGCFRIDATHDFHQARQSQNFRQNYPEYKIFLNNPGANDLNYGDYPDGVIGHLVDGSLSTDENCNGTVTFTFETAPFNAQGTSEIFLQLSAIVPQPIPPYADRILQNVLTSGGIHHVVWDGKDANGVQIPSGSTFPFTLRYMSGMTHLPLFDVENNIHGFKVNLVRPLQVPPLDDPAFYWDDQLISGPAGTINIMEPGCTDMINGCHGWGSTWPAPYNQLEWGNEKTINTWWFLVSSSTLPGIVTYKRAPAALIPVNPPTDICQGATATFTVLPDINATQYHWSWDWGSQVTALPTITITFPIIAPPGITHVYVYGTNPYCPDGPTTDIALTIHGLPVSTVTGPNPVCSMSTQVYSTEASMFNYNWTVTGGNVIAGQGTVQATITWNNAGTGVVSVTYLDQYGCGASSPGTLSVTVNPLPSASIAGATTVCLNSVSPLVTFTGSTATAPYTFSYNINGGPPQAVTTTIGNSVSVPVPTGTLGSFTYNLLGVQESSATHCFRTQAGSVTITVNPLPLASISGTTTVCQNSPSPRILFTGSNATAPYTFTYNINGGTNKFVTTVAGDTVSVAAPTNVTGTFIYNIISVSDGSPAACWQLQSGSATVTVNPLPTATVTGTTTVCLNSAAPVVTFTGSTTVPPYTFTYTINGGTPQAITTVAGNSVTVPCPTNGAGTFTYDLVSVQDAGTPSCSNNQSGSAVITVNTLPTATIAGTTAVCQDAASPMITFTGSGTTPPYTFTYDINGGLVQTVTATVGNTTTVPAPTNFPGVFTYNLVSVEDGSPVHCAQAQSGNVTITIHPLPVTTIVGPVITCQDFPSFYQYQTSVIEAAPATYNWSVVNGNGTIMPVATANPISINWNAPGTPTLVVNAVNTLGCASTGSVPVTVNPKPAVSIIACFDLITTRSAKRFLLKGGNPLYPPTGSPLQGEYLVNPPTPALQLDPGGNYYFNPSVVPGTGPAVFDISYKYTNHFGCPATKSSVQLTVLDLNPPCGNHMTDPRDGKVYTTALINGQCWMTQNLDHDMMVTPIHENQTDNCIVEKYCPPSDPTCSVYGGYYQWEELIQYRNTDAPYKGVCPPAWHVPTEGEWQGMIDHFDPSIGSPSANGRVGTELKDLAMNFKADTKGINYLNSPAWDFISGTTATMFWTSTISGTQRAVARGLNNPYNASISIYPSSVSNSFPVRCVFDW
jgi:uncharacterized protein (TIGR02145 family)